MNRQKSILFITVLALIGATACVLAKTNQRLGLPGVKTRPLAGSPNLEVLLPEVLPGYLSEWLPEGAAVTNGLPQDTSYGQRRYTADDGFSANANVVLMGSSRASIHKPQVCLTSQGWAINDNTSHEERVHLDRPIPYDLPVMRLNASAKTHHDGQIISAVYVYWFVDADRCTASHATRMIWAAKDIVLKGELDRWAYVSFISECLPGQEDATFDRMKSLIAASVPEFQLVPQAPK